MTADGSELTVWP